MSNKLTFKNTNQPHAIPVVKQETRSSLDDKIAIVYHGTSEDAALHIRENGLNCSMRCEAGATLMLNKITGLDDKDSQNYSYVSTDPSEAAKYAKCHRIPCIVSMICPRNLLKKDPQSGTDTAFKVKKISQKYLLPRKKGELPDNKINIIIKKLKEDGIYLKDSDVFNFIKAKWKNPKKSLEKCRSSAVEIVKQSQRRIQNIIRDVYRDENSGEILSISPDMLESLA